MHIGYSPGERPSWYSHSHFHLGSANAGQSNEYTGALIKITMSRKHPEVARKSSHEIATFKSHWHEAFSIFKKGRECDSMYCNFQCLRVLISCITMSEVTWQVLTNKQRHVLWKWFTRCSKYSNRPQVNASTKEKNYRISGLRDNRPLTMVPRENKNNPYAKFGGTNKEYYGIFRSGL